MTEQPVGLRTARGLALVGWALVAGALVVALVVAEGQARGHAFFHLAFAVAALAGVTGVTFAPRGAGRGRGLPWFLLAALGLLAVGSLLESIGGAGYDRFNDGSRIETLTTIHGFATPLAGIALPIAAGAIIVAAGSALSGRMRRRMAGGPGP